jgi:hypothetical protein
MILWVSPQENIHQLHPVTQESMKLALNIHCAFVDMLLSATAGYHPQSSLELHHAETTTSASHLEAHFQAALHLHVVQFITTGRSCYIIFSASHL